MSQTIEIIVSPDGSSRVETRGFQGPGCRTASQFIEQALGRQVTERLKPEFYGQSSQQQQHQKGTSS
jgi:hypothetical protein